MNVLFTCGGTAGHINPAVALARMFLEREEGCQVLFVGADGGMETRLVPKEGFELRTVTITNFRRSLTPAAIGHNLGTVVNMVRSDRQAKAILDEFKPDLVVGTGGYASFPVVKAAAKRGIPTAVHESNAVPGLTTKALSKVCDVVMVGFAESREQYEDPSKVVVTGTPVRGDFFRRTRLEARRELGIEDDRPLLLSYWGSLGAERMNGYMTEFIALESREGAPFRHIHGAGRDFSSMTRDLATRGGSAQGVEVREYIYDMPLVMAAADLVLCRSGASTVSELAAIAKPSVLVPSPNVTADHQTKNARILANAGGAVLLPEKECSGERLYRTAADLLHSPEKRSEMARRLSELAIPDANEKIFETLKRLLK
ncbi:MAG: undecaprenyldiphospho-muramoylpentapeptide beta-N-acetylglucosaminyltransferase [Oscillospiraceae bacterium]|nr:undecaprenyldiphospho-muramoylpentapeptide beta-N-acetylglucosaminyltransferase [Oscillospiraceae bacterium]